MRTIRQGVLLVCLLLSGFSIQAEEKALNIYTVNYPLQYFTKSIVGDSANVILPMPKDIDPAFWSPSVEDIAALQTADLIMLNGANYAKWLPKVSLPLFKMVNTSSSFRDNYIAIEIATKHKHGTGGEHSHSGTAFTTWLDFSQAAEQAETIYKALSKKSPKAASGMVANFVSLKESLTELDEQLLNFGESLQAKPLLGSHPVYQYFKRRYQFNLQSVHWEPEEAPSEEQWNLLKDILKSHPAKWMLWEGQPMQETVEKLEELGVKSIVFSPCANQPEKGDFLTIMRDNVEALTTITKK